MNKPSILIVEDEAIVAMHLAAQLEGLGYQVAGISATAQEAVRLAEEHRPDLVLMDVQLQGPEDGIWAARAIRDRFRLPVVFLTAYAEDTTLERAKVTEPFGYVIKPFEERELKTVIEMALYKHRADAEIRRLNRLYAVLSHVNQAIVRAGSRDDLFQAVCRIAVEHGGFRLAWIGWLDESGQLLTPVAREGAGSEFLSGLSLALDGHPEPLGAVGTVARQGQPCVLNEFPAEGHPPSWRPALAAMAVRSAALVPVLFHGKTAGTLGLYSEERHFFQESEAGLLREIAADMSFAVEQMEKETRRQQAEEAVRQARRDWENIFQAIGHPTLILNNRHQVIEANTAALQLVNARPGELNGQTCFQVFHGPQFACPPEGCGMSRLLQAGVSNPVEMEMEALGRVFLVSCTPVLGPDGALDRVIHISTDITRRRQAEDQLARSEALYHSLVETLPQNVFQKDLEGRFTFVNQQFCQTARRPVHDILGRTDLDLFDPELAKQYRLDDQRVVQSGKILEQVEKMRLPEGSLRIVRVCKTPVRDAQGRVTGVQGLFWDITEQQRAEEALRQSEANLAAAQKMARLGGWETQLNSLETPDANPIQWSDEVYRIFGLDPARAPIHRKTFLECVHPEDRPRIESVLREAIQQRKPYRIEHRIQRPDGTERTVAEYAEVVFDPQTGRPVKLVGTVQDITERTELEARLRQSQKMESFGTLAGGVAHDFNNILSVILMNAELLSVRTYLDADTLDAVRQITDAGHRAANLTRQLLTFSRQQPLRRQHLDLGAVVGNLSKMLRRIIGEDITLQCNFSPNELPVYADVGMVEQVLMNLAVNARDAMPQGGQLVITAERVQVDPARGPLPPGARPGSFACLRVQDTGTGIAPEHMSRLFEPFFTTKEVGKGTGLGLATAYGIVQQHEGWIEVESTPGRGATFRVFLPVAAEHAPAAEAAAPPPPARGGSEGILVVEDEASVRAMVLVCLKRLGYKVFEARNGPEALDVWARHKHAISLLFTDIVMPAGVSGADLATLLRRDNRTLKVVFMSGYSADFSRDWTLEDGVNYLPKPFAPSALGKIVRACLDAR